MFAHQERLITGRAKVLHVSGGMDPALGYPHDAGRDFLGQANAKFRATLQKCAGYGYSLR